MEEHQDILIDLPSEAEEEPSSEFDKGSKSSKISNKVTQPNNNNKTGTKKQAQQPEEKEVNYDDADYESDKLFAYDSNEEEDESDSAVSGSMVGQKRRRGSDEDQSESGH